MITLLLSLVLGGAVAGAAAIWIHWWALLIGVAVFGGAQFGAGRFLKSRLEREMKGVQDILMNGQKRLKQKMAQWQIRPPGSVKQAQLEMEKDQRAFIEKALEEVKKLEKWEKWSPLLKKQITTMKLQLHWQLRDMKGVDALMPGAMFIDPMSLAMRLARQIMLNEPAEKIRKTFTKSVARMRYKEGALLYGIYSWSLVQRNELDAAHKILIEANEKLEHETLKRNKAAIANNQPKQFSNAGFGDEWYALWLEEPPKPKVQRQQPPRGGRPF
jgi:BMFP domain-containing protein YqiC